VAYHDAPVSAANAFWSHQVDWSVGSGLFSGYNAPQPPGSQYADAGVIWPKQAISVCGADTIVHTIATWAGEHDEIWYWRAVWNGMNPVVYSDPVLLDIGAYVTAAIEARGSEVTVGYIKNNNGTNWDVMYRRSTDCGTWWGEPPVNITNYTAADPEGAYTELALVYDEAGDIHIFWNTVPADGDVGPTNLYMWYSWYGIRLVTSADWRNRCGYGAFGTGINNGAGNANVAIADLGVAVKPAGLGPGSGISDELLYAIWTQFGPTDLDCATKDAVGTLGGYVNGELYWSVSSNGGVTWDRPRTFTGTNTPDCLPGDCMSEAWVTVAAQADSGLYLSYVDDRHAGAAPLGEGEWTDNPYMVLALETRAPVVEPVIAVTPTEFLELNVTPGASQNAYLTVASVGNADLTYTVNVLPDNGGQSHILINDATLYSNTILAGSPPDIVTITYDGVGLPFPSEQDWALEVTSNDPVNDPGVGGAPIRVDLQVFVADVWYTCVTDTISTGQHRLQVSSCLELGCEGRGQNGFFSYADSAEWLFGASPIIAWLDGGGTKTVYRDIYWTGVADRSRDSNQSFRAQSPITVERDYSWDRATGLAFSTDSLFRIEYEVVTYKDPALTRAAAMKYIVMNNTGTTFYGLHLGMVADLDVDSMFTANWGFTDASNEYIGVQGGWRDTAGIFTTQDYYAALFHIPMDQACDERAVGAQMLDNRDYVYPERQFNTDSLYELCGRIFAWNPHALPADTPSDLSMVLLDRQGATLGAADTVKMAFGLAVSDVSLADLEATIAAMREAINPECTPTVFSLLAPANGATVPPEVTFTWESVDGATTYSLVLQKGGEITRIDDIPLPTFTMMLPTGNYTWYVIALVGGTEYLSAETWSLTVSTLAGLAAYWSFDEGAGSIAHDATVNANHGTLMNGPAWVNGYSGKALEFDGTNDYVYVPDDVSLRPVAITLIAWLKPLTLPASGTYGPLIKRTPAWLDDANWQLQVLPTGRVNLEFFNGSWESSQMTDSALKLNEWNHVALTFVNREVRVYINGRLDPAFPYTTFKNLNVNYTSPVIIGKGEGDVFQGILDEVKVFNRALSAEEILVAYQGETEKGDVNADGVITSSDIIYLVNYVFKSGPEPVPSVSYGDVNCDGNITSADIIYLVSYVFKGGPPPLTTCT